jgi:hypothetical protein
VVKAGVARYSLSLLATLAAACASIVGIEDAEVDPTLRLGEGGAQGGDGGSATGGDAGAGGEAAEGGTAGSNGGASGGTVGGQGGGGADAGAGPPLCDEYCDAVIANCDTHRVYASPLICQAICEILAPGSPGDRSGNTVHCRLSNAELAVATGEPTEHCPAAGPGGAGICGDDCASYCVLMAHFCPDFGTEEECRGNCPSIPTIGGYNTTMTSGNTLECRLYHVSAATQDARTHCPHAAGMEAFCIP